jgi:hypothetical protein
MHPHQSVATGATFNQWLDILEGLMREWDAAHGNLPYELPLDRAEDNGNVLCWKDSYDDGMTPGQAFDSDKTYWEE